MALYYIKDGRLHLLKGKKGTELPDGIYDGYVRRAEMNAKRKEWKRSGEGAKFTGVYEPTEASAVVTAKVNAVGEHDGTIYYSEQIDDISGIYKKENAFDTGEKVGISDNRCEFFDFDIHDGVMAVSIGRATGTHIGVCTLPSFDIDMVTEGDSHDTDVCFSRVRKDTLYFASRGIARRDSGSREAQSHTLMTPASVMQMMGEATSGDELGPSSICRLNLKTGELETLLEQDGYDFVKPQCALDGSLYYIKKPYKQESTDSTFGCLTDILLMPFRLLAALFGFLSFFSMKYSGKTLSSNQTKAKSKSEKEIFIDGNLINAERELKANRSDDNPGIIPRSYELHRIDRKGNDTVIKKGVLCYTIDSTGAVVCSNGKHILRIDAFRREEALACEEYVTYIRELDTHQ